MSAVAGNSNSNSSNNNNNNINNNKNIGHKLNENLIFGARNGFDKNINATTSTTTTTATAPLTTISQSDKSNNNLKSHLNHQQTTLSSKLQQQQQQRRSLLPSPAAAAHSNHTQHHNHIHQQQHQSTQQQQKSVTFPTVASANLAAVTNKTTTTTAATSATAHPNQVQTIATIHHEQPQQIQQQPKHQQSSPIALQANGAVTLQRPSLSNLTTSEGKIVGNSQIRRSLYQHQQPNKTHSYHSLKASTHSIPPRYQPPPQPSNGGILKHCNGANPAQSNGVKSTQSYFSEATGGHYNLKYPPDIPQLSTIYIPDSLKIQGSLASFQQKHQHQQQQHQHQHQQQQQQQQAQTQQQQDMLKFVRKTDQDHPSPSASVMSSQTGLPTATGHLTAEQNRQLQSLINELRALKDQNQRLLDDNQELRDLCCFLDDDRQKGRKLAREWQRFGRYTASVMRQEVAAYQNKLRQLDDKQQELITDNLELKELCLYLDEERAHVAANALCANCGASVRNALRDDGDGSSSSTNADETISALRNYERQLPDVHLRNATAATTTALTTLNDQTLQYVRSLERRIQQLEKERVTSATPTANATQQQSQQQTTQQQIEAALAADPISGRPEAVVRALQVLEVREQIERDRVGNLTGATTLDQMDDGEKALVREMCNVVWRKLESSPPGPTTLETL